MQCHRVLQREGYVFSEFKPAPDQVYLTAIVKPGSVDSGELADSIYRDVLRILESDGAVIVLERVFGSMCSQASVLEARDRVLNVSSENKDGAITFVQGNPVWRVGLAGVQIQAVCPGSQTEDIRVLSEQGVPCGRAWRRHGTTFLMLQNLHGAVPSQDASPDMQAGHMFERAERILKREQGDYRDMVRTWLYLSDILEWYNDFNKVRNQAYARFGIMPSTTDHEPVRNLSLPASTGIEGNNPAGAACLMDALALIGSNKPEIVQMSNMRQKDAFRYRSAFSRGACIKHPDFKEIQISGTAAIDEQGISLHPGDFRNQVLRTFENVEALLAQQGATLQNICTGTAFLKRPQDAQEYQAITSELGLGNLPCVCVIADICRDDLLFEIDGVATVPMG